MSKEKKITSVEELKESIEKRFGKNSFTTLGEAPMTDVEVVSTGSIGLDAALGVGGLPFGRIVEIFSLESCGKTTLAMHTIANAQNQGKRCAFIDQEHAFDKSYAESLGINTNELVFYQGNNGEEALDYIEALLDSKMFQVIVLDSCPACVPTAELEGEMGDNQMGLQARLFSKAMRKLVAKVADSNCLLILINQMREKIGVMYGDTFVTTCGNSIRFYASVRLKMTRSVTKDNTMMEGDTKVGNLTKVEVIKNKVAPPFGKAEFFIRYGIGVDRQKEIIDLAKDQGVISQRGQTITYGETKILETELIDNTEMFSEIEHQLLEKLKK